MEICFEYEWWYINIYMMNIIKVSSLFGWWFNELFVLWICWTHMIVVLGLVFDDSTLPIYEW